MDCLEGLLVCVLLECFSNSNRMWAHHHIDAIQRQTNLFNLTNLKLKVAILAGSNTYLVIHVSLCSTNQFSSLNFFFVWVVLLLIICNTSCV